MDLTEVCISRLDEAKSTGVANCSKLELKLVPAEMYFDQRFRKLRLLDLSSNALNTLTEDAMKQMKHLQELNLSDNLIRAIPAQLPHLLSALMRLDLSKCMIDCLPANITALSRLQFLDLSHNCLRQLPAELCTMESLHYVGVEGNKMEFPPMEVCRRGEKAVLQFLKHAYEEKQLLEGRRRHAMKALRDLKTVIEPTLTSTSRKVERCSIKAEQLAGDIAEAAKEVEQLHQEILEEKGKKPVEEFKASENHLKGISRSDLAAIKQLKNPSNAVKKTMEAIWRMLNRNDSKRAPAWDTADSNAGVKNMVGRADFISRLFAFDPATLPPSVVVLLRRDYFQQEELNNTLKAAARASKAAGMLCAWASNQVALAESLPPDRPITPAEPVDTRNSIAASKFNKLKANLGFLARTKSEEDRRRDHEVLKKQSSPLLSPAEFELLQKQHEEVGNRLKQLEHEHEVTAGEEREARSVLTELQEQSRQAIEILHVFDIDPALWDQKLDRVKRALSEKMRSGPARICMFNWWENMVSGHVGSMAKIATHKFKSGEIGRELAQHTNITPSLVKTSVSSNANALVRHACKGNAISSAPKVNCSELHPSLVK